MSANLQQISQQIQMLPVPEQKQLNVWLNELLSRKTPENGSNSRQKVIAALHEAGLLTAPGMTATALAETSNITLAEVKEAFRQAGGQPLSEFALELRGPKE